MFIHISIRFVYLCPYHIRIGIVLIRAMIVSMNEHMPTTDGIDSPSISTAPLFAYPSKYTSRIHSIELTFDLYLEKKKKEESSGIDPNTIESDGRSISIESRNNQSTMRIFFYKIVECICLNLMAMNFHAPCFCTFCCHFAT